MASGEYTSAALQREPVQAEVDVERHQLSKRSLDEMEELSRDPEQALELHAREELGINPDDLPSPTVAAVSSFASFALGALLPVLPYLLGATRCGPELVRLALVGLSARRERAEGQAHRLRGQVSPWIAADGDRRANRPFHHEGVRVGSLGRDDRATQ